LIHGKMGEGWVEGERHGDCSFQYFGPVLK
jgi:hypothetical protein